jgi:hypothetical protein
LIGWGGRGGGGQVRSSSHNRLLIFSLGATFWALWKASNKMPIEKKIVTSPRMIVFNLISFLQQWKILLSEGEKKTVGWAIKKLKKKLSDLKRRNRQDSVT